MLFDYCPECARVKGFEENCCENCGYSGNFNRGAMDEVNAYRKKIGRSSAPSVRGGMGAIVNSALNEESKNGDCSIPQNRGLKEKLARLKGKSTSEYEFL